MGYTFSLPMFKDEVRLEEPDQQVPDNTIWHMYNELEQNGAFLAKTSGDFLTLVLKKVNVSFTVYANKCHSKSIPVITCLGMQLRINCRRVRFENCSNCTRR